MQPLSGRFRALTTPTGDPGQVFASERIDSKSSHRIAKDSKSRPYFLFDAKPVEDPPADIVLRNLAVNHRVSCEVDDSGVTTQRVFSIVGCIADDAALHEHFIHSVSGLLERIGPQPSESDVARGIGRLIELFRLLAEPPRATVQGIWAELFVVAEARDPGTMLRAWHVGPEGLFDFSHDDERLEVKSASGFTRVHTFRLEQLQPPQETRVLVCSVLTQRVGVGTSLPDLMDEIRSHIKGDLDLETKLADIVASTLGRELLASLTASFDRQRARESLAFYRVEDIPRLNEVPPLGISDIHFKSDLSAAEPLEPTVFVEGSGLFASLPR